MYALVALTIAEDPATAFTATEPAVATEEAEKKATKTAKKSTAKVAKKLNQYIIQETK